METVIFGTVGWFGYQNFRNETVKNYRKIVKNQVETTKSIENWRFRTVKDCKKNR